MQSDMFFDGWSGPLRIIAIAPFAYVALVFFLRISGKRTLSKLNAFDLVITVALGSTLATQILSRDTPLIDGIAAFVLLIALQWTVTSLSLRSRIIRGLVRAKPRVLLQDGKLQHVAMHKERVTEDEVLQAIRSGGGEEFHQAHRVYLETDGGLTAIVGNDEK